MQKTLLMLLLALVLTAWSTSYVKAQAQPQPLDDEEYYDEELPIEDTQPAQPAQPVAQPPPPPPPPVATRPTSLFSRPGGSRISTIRERQTTTTAAPILEPEPDPVAAPAPQRSGSRSSAGAAAAGARGPGLSAASTSSDAPAHNEFFECPEKFGFFPHHRSCDKYWKCEESQAILKLCGNGLIFDATDLKRESCNYPFAADCGDRTELEPPQGTEFCPRLYGIFADETDCRIFWSCWGGEAKKYECSPGLAFDESNRVCTWADKVERCKNKEVAEGLSCPDSTAAETAGTYSRHGHPEDCRKFFVCIDHTPRMYGCELGTVFNLETLMCDDPENVPGCEEYYGDLDIKTLKKAQLAGFAAPEKKPVAPKAAALDEQV